MRISDTERHGKPSEEDRVPRRRAILWGLIGVAILLGVYLYFQYERVLAPLVS
jgi:type VI protein secretion system component VasF